MNKHECDWKVLFGEFNAPNTDYSVEIGIIRNIEGSDPYKTVYLRLWHKDSFLCGSTLDTFKDPSLEPLTDIIRQRIEATPSGVITFCIQLAERFNSLKAFA